MVQDVIVYILLIIALGDVIIHCVRLVSHKEGRSQSCGSCGHCDLKKIVSRHGSN